MFAIAGHGLVVPGATWDVTCAARVGAWRGERPDALELACGTLDEALDAVVVWAEEVAAWAADRGRADNLVGNAQLGVREPMRDGARKLASAGTGNERGLDAFLAMLQAFLDQQKWEPALEVCAVLLAGEVPADTLPTVAHTQAWATEKLNRPDAALKLWETHGGGKWKSKLRIKDSIADITLQQVLTRPKEFDVIATLNLNGDYLSDALAAQVGGIGIAPGGNINYDSGHAVFEATHGTAPKYADLDVINPSSVILSGVMMLEHMGWQEAGDLIINGIVKTIAQKRVTYDLERQMEVARRLWDASVRLAGPAAAAA